MSAERVRHQLASAVRQLISGTGEPPVRKLWEQSAPGPIPIDSPARRVHQDASMFVGGVRALLFQTLHPVTMSAVAEHSSYETDPLGRLRRTAHFLATTTYGTATDAEQALRTVRSIHARVVGTLPDGTEYRADDPELLAWVHVTEIDSFLAAFQRYGPKPLTENECDQYVADMAIIGTALGVEDAPRSQTELAARIDSFRPQLAATDVCRDATRFLFAPALPLSVLPFYALVFSSATAMLPRWARSMLLLPIAPGVDPLVLRPAMTGLTRTLRWALAGPATTGATTRQENAD